MVSLMQQSAGPFLYNMNMNMNMNLNMNLNLNMNMNLISISYKGTAVVYMGFEAKKFCIFCVMCKCVNV